MFLHGGAGPVRCTAQDRAEEVRVLAVGVVGWSPEFRAGDGVELLGEDGVPFARGIASVDAPELAGRPANVEAVHRDRLVLL